MTDSDKQLLEACLNGDAAAARRALDAGANVDAGAGEEQTPLMLCTMNGNTTVARLLLARGANPNGVNKNGSTALMHAVFHSQTAMVPLLREAGADPRVRNLHGREALDYAKDNNRAVFRQLLAAAADEVSFTYPVADRVMEEVFHFKLKERITLLRKEEGGAVESMLRDSFSTLDESSLRKAFDLYRKRGGTAREEDIFADAMDKKKISAPKLK